MAHTLQVRYASLVDAYLRKNLWSDFCFNLKYEGNPKAGTVKVPTRAEVSVGAYNKATGIALSQQDTTYVDIAINKDYAINEIVDGYDAAALPDNIIADRLESGAYGLKKQLDSDGFATLVAGGTEDDDIVAVSASNVSSKVLATMQDLDNADVDQENRWIIVTPAVHAFMLQDSTFIKASEMGQEMLVRGQIGEYYGFRVFKSTNMPTNTSAGNTLEYIAGHSANAHRVVEWMKEPFVVSLDSDSVYVGASAVKGRKVYGHKVSRATTVRIKGTGAITV